MSHLLASVNPAAAAAFQESPQRPRLPDVGETVRYHMRHGHGRQGRTRFSALVQGHGPNDTLTLTVIIDAGDLVDESLVSEIGPGNEFHCWERVEGPGVRSLAERLEEPAGLRGLVVGAQAAIDDLRASVLGEYDAPKISIIAIMQDFETRLRNIKNVVDQAMAAFEAAGSAPAAAPRKPRKPRAAKKAAKAAKKAGKRGR